MSPRLRRVDHTTNLICCGQSAEGARLRGHGEADGAARVDLLLGKLCRHLVPLTRLHLVGVRVPEGEVVYVDEHYQLEAGGHAVVHRQLQLLIAHNFVAQADIWSLQ